MVVVDTRYAINQLVGIALVAEQPTAGNNACT